MKKILFVVLMAMILIAAMGGVAFADRNDSGYLAPTAGVSPHGGYDTTTQYCAVCHAVHNASATGEVLLRSTVTNACAYCHVNAGNTFDIKMVYGGDPTYYDGTSVAVGYDAANGHTAATGGDMSDTNVKCTDCHQVHGATQSMATTDLYMSRKILKWNALLKDADFSGIAANADDTTAVDDNISGYCSQCHTYYNTAYNGDSHAMRSTFDDYQNAAASASVRGGSVAFDDSGSCRACHQRGVTNVAGGAGNTGVNNYPHYTDGYRFLASGLNVQNAAASAGSTDGNCLVCHASNDGTTIEGVGLSF